MMFGEAKLYPVRGRMLPASGDGAFPVPRKRHFRSNARAEAVRAVAAVIALAAMAAAPLPAWAQSSAMDLFSGPDAVKWGPAPPSLPKGAMLALLSGDPSKDGPYALRLKLPANYQIPAHHHPMAENVTVISGSLHAGMGDKLDAAKGQTFAPGGYISMPAGMNHYAWSTTETILQVNGNGPFGITYVNPADDPSKTP